MSEAAVVPLSLAGHVLMRDHRSGRIVLDQENLVVNAMYELLIRGLTAEDNVARVHAVLSSGLPITKGLRTLGSPLLNVPVEAGGDAAPVKSVDQRGLRSICTWTALLRPTGSVTYDSLGLVSKTGLLCAATSFIPITLSLNDIISVQWTIALRGS